MLGPQELLTAGLRQAEGGGHGVALGLLGNGLQEGIAIVAAEGAHPQGRAGGGGNGQVQGLGDGQAEALGAAVHGLLAGHGGGDRQIGLGLLAQGGQGDAETAALQEQAGGAGIAIGGGHAGLCLQVRAVGGGNGDVDGVIRALHPAVAVVGGIDLIDAVQGEHVVLIGLHGQHQAAVALALGVVALHQIVTGRQLGVHHQLIAVGLGGHIGQQVPVSLDAIGEVIQLQGRQLGAVQAFEGDVQVALGRVALLGHGNGVGGGSDGGGPLGGLRRVAAADGQDGAVMDGHGLHPAIVGAVGREIDLVDLVGGGGRHPDAGDALGQGQGVGGLVGGEVGSQDAFAEGQGRQAGVALGVPVAADVRAVAVGGVHHADGIPGEQLVPGLDVVEPNVGEPIVQGSHPAGGGSAVTGGQAVDLADVAGLGTGLGIGTQGADDAVHHGGPGGQVHPLVHQRAIPGSAVGLCVGRVFHDDPNLAVVVLCCPHGGGYQAQYHHQCQQQRNDAFLHMHFPPVKYLCPAVSGKSTKCAPGHSHKRAHFRRKNRRSPPRDHRRRMLSPAHNEENARRAFVLRRAILLPRAVEPMAPRLHPTFSGGGAPNGGLSSRRPRPLRCILAPTVPFAWGFRPRFFQAAA